MRIESTGVANAYRSHTAPVIVCTLLMHMQIVYPSAQATKTSNKHVLEERNQGSDDSRDEEDKYSSVSTKVNGQRRRPRPSKRKGSPKERTLSALVTTCKV